MSARSEAPGDTWTVGTDAGDSGSSAPAAGGALAYGYYTEPRVMDPIAVTDTIAADGGFAFAVFDSLMVTDFETGSESTPHLAAALESDDNVLWNLRLREDVVFHDGTPLDADAVKFNWDRYLAEAAQPSAGAALIESVEVTDPVTVTITLTRPEPQFGGLLGGLNFIGSPTAIEALGDQFGNAPVGAGPFVFDTWARGSSMHLTRNADYWDEGKPYLDELTILVMPNPAARVNALLAGDTDIAISTPDTHEQLSAQGLVQFPSPNDPPFGGAGWIFNTAVPPFDDVDVRCGLIQAIDMELMGEQLAAGTTPIPDSYFHRGDLADAATTLPGFDPAAAQAVFDTYAQEHGEPLSFTFDGLELAATQMESYLTQFAQYDNLDVELAINATPDLIAKVSAGSHQIAQLGWGSGDIPAAAALAQFGLGPDGGAHPFTGFTSPEFQEQLLTATTTTDVAERDAALLAVNDIIVSECLYRPTPRVNLGDPFGSDSIQGWAYTTISPTWEEVWLDE